MLSRQVEGGKRIDGLVREREEEEEV